MGLKKTTTINQILDICHEILLSFDSNPLSEERVVFLDISKANDKVWHEGLVKCNDTPGEPLSLPNGDGWMDNHYQRTLLNGKTWSGLMLKVVFHKDLF